MEWLQQVSVHTTFLTPNRRLAAYHANEYKLNQIAQGQKTWHSMDILPFNSWLERLWFSYFHQTLNETIFLLNPMQELIVWENIITQSKESEHLLQKSATAEIAKAAWGLLKQWQIKLNDPALQLTEDSTTFLKWAAEFKKQCEQNNWIDQYSLTDTIIKKITTHHITVPKKIVLIGFNDLSPQQKKIIEACQHAGTEVQFFTPAETAHTQKRISLANKETEILSMAKWCKAILDKNPDSKTYSIACVIPNLEDVRDTVDRIFTDVFTEKGIYRNNSLDLPFNISAGKSLASYPVIHTALQLLSLGNDTIPIETWSNLLRSPFLGRAENEMLQRAHVDIQLKHDNINLISVKQLIKNKMLPPALCHHFQNYVTYFNSVKSKQTYNAWLEFFIELLTLMGWPGEREVNSEEYQVIQRWLTVLDDFRQYDYVLPECSYKSALHILKLLTANTVFQIQSPETPIQILGILEAAGLPFDYLWMMGMDDTNWPPTPKPNPFIPASMQRSLHMPHASAERELAFCKTILAQLKNSAREIIFSHAQFDHEAEIRMSSLIEDVPAIHLENLTLSNYQPLAQIIFDHKKIETLSDTLAPAIQPNQTVAGGSRLFELQAACPFRAFAELRLFAKAVDATSLGLRAIDRGNLIHKTLELIWLELKDSHTLHAKTTEELQTLILQCIETAMHDWIQNNKKSQYLQLETQRLQKMIWDWLMIEKSRPAFKVTALEQKYEINFANIKIHLRIDRIDELENNEKIIIDYKTGKNYHVQHWFGDRPDSPQLPLYCLIDPDKTIGIAFAMLHPETMTLTGISKNPLQTASIAPIGDVKYENAFSWEEQLLVWRETLEQLSQDFCQGNAAATPKKYPQTCEHCHLKSFCRIHENNDL